MAKPHSKIDNVRHIHGQAIPDATGVVPEVVECLRKMLVRAKAGEIRGVAVIAIDRVGKVDNDFTKSSHRHHMISGTEYLKRDLMNN